MNAQRRLGLVLGGCLVMAGCTGQASPEQMDTQARVPVVTVLAVAGSVSASLELTGQLAPAPGADFLLAAPDAGRLTELPRGEGDRVARGEVLARLDAPAVALEVRIRQAEQGRTLARVTAARAALARAALLFERGVGARRDVEEATREVSDAEGASAQADAALTSANSVARQLEVRAPFDGVVVHRAHNVGDQVTAGDLILRFVDPSRLEVVAMVPVADLARLHAGARGRLTAPAAQAATAVTVAALPTLVDPASTAAPVRLHLDHPLGLPIGSPVGLSMTTETHAGVVLVPVAAIRRDDTQASVFVVSDGTAHRHVVDTGLSDGRRTELRSGVAIGEAVIVQGHTGLPDDAAVNPTAAP